MAANDEILDRTIRHQLFLERLKTQEANDIMGFFNTSVVPDIERTVIQGDPTLKATVRFKRMESLYKSLISEGFIKIGVDHAASAAEIALMEAAFQKKILEGVTRELAIDFALPSATQLKAIVNQDFVRGKFVKKWFKEIGDNLAGKVTEQIQIGLAEGESLPQIVRRIKGTRALRFTDGIVDKSRRDLNTIVRTSVNNVTTKAREMMFKQNEDVIKGVRYDATLDSRTTVICGNLDGRVFPILEGPRPPQHMN